MTTFKLTEEQKEYLAGQRTNLKKDTVEDAAQKYYAECIDDVEALKPFLEKGSSFLDIGCGLGGVSAVITELFPNMKGYLFDKTGKATQAGYSHNSKGFFNSLNETAKFMESNTKTDVTITDSLVELPDNIDVVFSILSMGFHYSANTYADELQRIVSGDGVLLINERPKSLNACEGFSRVAEIPFKRKGYLAVYKRLP